MKKTHFRLRLSMALSILILVAGCSWLGPREDAYKESKLEPSLEAPPEITLPPKNNAYAIPKAEAPANCGKTEEGGKGAPAIQIKRDAQLRWLDAPYGPDEAWKKVLAFWKQRDVELAEQDEQLKLLKTEWIEARQGLPSKGLKNLVKKALGGDSDLVLRDQYRVRVEDAGNGRSNIYLTHRGAYLTAGKDGATRWEMRQPEPEAEGEMLQALQLFLAHSR